MSVSNDMNNFWLFGLGMFLLFVLPILTIAHALEISPHIIVRIVRFLDLFAYVALFCIAIGIAVFDFLVEIFNAIRGCWRNLIGSEISQEELRQSRKPRRTHAQGEVLMEVFGNFVPIWTIVRYASLGLIIVPTIFALSLTGWAVLSTVVGFVFGVFLGDYSRNTSDKNANLLHDILLFGLLIAAMIAAWAVPLFWIELSLKWAVWFGWPAHSVFLGALLASLPEDGFN